MMYEEMSASYLIKIDHNGQVLFKPDFGDLNYSLNKPGYILHSAVHKARIEVDCVIHIHTAAGMTKFACLLGASAEQTCPASPTPAHAPRTTPWYTTCWKAISVNRRQPTQAPES
jgi:ribulose-5-phosphate 4-epimerase/fuculose-1-phosphate aldolase